MSETKIKKNQRISVLHFINRNPIPKRYKWWVKKQYPKGNSSHPGVFKTEEEWRKELIKQKIIQE